MNIILVHGIFDNGQLFKQMVSFLEKAGHKCYVPLLKPIDARKGVIDLSVKLNQFITNSLGETEKFVLVGFSMGCLVSRYYLQELNGVERCLAFYAISGPHQGFFSAYFYIGRGAVDMRPGSEFLAQLKAGESKLASIPLFTYRTPFDLMILPSSSSHWEMANNYVTNVVMHRYMLRDKFVCNHISQTLSNLS
jgi:triacylglycerol lipase